MKLTIVSDTHCEYKWIENLEEGDVFIHCGDIDIQCERHLSYFNDVLKDLPFKYKIVVGGNHDTYLEKIGKFQIEERLTNAIYLENCGVILEEKLFWGSPITPEFNNWAFNRIRGNEIKKYWDLIPNDTDVLITHSAPYGILDTILLANGAPGKREGDLDLYKKVEELRQNELKIHCFGHFHNSSGVLQKNNTKFINASLMDESYTLVNKPITVEI